ncbi:MAG: 2-dehydro-3-deoxy-D-gluconate 5-dehydrogenase KduD [Saprospiraceae bacterium]|nr:2-dehydro-3-deoxy-D-gluconate 5-dehydrogenase KduD [Saprospiraceae bacterium]
MLDQFSLANKTAMITGASRGLGQAMAIALANAGAFVICCSSSEGGTKQTIQQIEAAGGRAAGLFADLSNRQAVKEMFDAAIDQYGTIDILVNNGGTIARFPAVEFPLDEWDRVLEVNLSAAFYLSQLVGAKMIEKGGGKIINIASMLSYSGGITVPAYTASKHAIAGLTKALANEWAGHNLQINAIAPGYFKTDNTQKLQDDPVRNEAITKRIPAGRWGEPSDLGGAVVFLASAASNYLNGTIINVDGGWMAR